MEAFITDKTPGLLPLDRSADYAGKTLVVAIECLGVQYKKAAFQLFKAMGGNGCRADALGTKVFGIHIADNDEGAFRRSDFIGEASPELIEQALADKTPVPIIPENMVYIAIGNNMCWGKGTTEDIAKKQMRKAGSSKCLIIYHAHETAYVTDMGGLSWPEAAPAAKVIYTHPSLK